MTFIDELKDILDEFLVCDKIDEQTLKITWIEVGDSLEFPDNEPLFGYLTLKGLNAQVKVQTFRNPERTRQQKKLYANWGIEEIYEGNLQYSMLRIKLNPKGLAKFYFRLGILFEEASERQ